MNIKDFLRLRYNDPVTGDPTWGLSGWPRKQRGGEQMRKRRKKPPSQATKRGRGLLAKVISLVPRFSVILKAIELVLRLLKIL